MRGLDVACWDALAVAAGLPLVRLLGAAPRPVPAYNSNGLGLIAPAAAGDGGRRAGGGGLHRGQAAPRPTRRRRRPRRGPRGPRRGRGRRSPSWRTSTRRCPCRRPALRCRLLDDEGLAWIEEPIRHDDYAGTRRAGRRPAHPGADRRELRRARARWPRRWRPARPTSSCPTSTASAASPAGSRPPRSPTPPASRCRATCTRRSRAPARRHSHRPLAGVRRLGHPDPGRAAPGRRRCGPPPRGGRQRCAVGPGGRGPLPSGVTYA